MFSKSALIALASIVFSCAAAAAEPAPDFELKSLDGKTVHLADYRGKVVFLDFWASWCPPCRGSIPAVEKLHEKYAAKNLYVLGINMEENPGTVRKFAASKGMKYPVLLGNETVARAYKVGGIPAFFLIGPDGSIVKRFMGYQPGMEKEWEQGIDALLNSLPNNPNATKGPKDTKSPKSK